MTRWLARWDLIRWRHENWWLSHRGRRRKRRAAPSSCIDGRAIAELFNKRRPFRITIAPGSSIISFRVMTTGVSRKHRKAVLDVDVELGADEGGLALVSCAHGYLWPLVRSKPAELRWRTGSDLHVPHPRLWRVGFSGDKPSDTDRVIIA